MSSSVPALLILRTEVGIRKTLHYLYRRFATIRHLLSIGSTVANIVMSPWGIHGFMATVNPHIPGSLLLRTTQ